MKLVLYIGVAFALLVLIVVVADYLLPRDHIASRSGVVVESLAPKRHVTRISDPSLPFGGTWTCELIGHHATMDTDLKHPPNQPGA